MLEDLKKDARERMAKCVQTFQAELKKQRTGRAHPSLVEHLKVDYYDAEVPLHQVASINVEEDRGAGHREGDP
jgi:ribosome recycling factor